MSFSLEALHQPHSSESSTNKNLIIYHTCILKSKENILKPKCNKVLKKKLKKYRLRRDGKEDDDIIDVSKILISSLKIKSPNKTEVKTNSSNTSPEERLPKNYLFKMVRKKNQCVKSTTKKEMNILESEKSDKQMLPILPESESNENRQMDAFKLLMDSRNKRIGGNSPCKEKLIDENDEIEIVKKKELKAKRNLVLQQMAQKKGYIKNQENEDYIDECIKRKLEKRAERLKQMITSNNSKRESKIKKTENSKINNKSKIISVTKLEEKQTVTKSGKLQLFNFLSDDEQSLNESQDNKKLSQEDDEFLKKLSPSIRKKENMLSYFKKVTKDTTDSDVEMTVNNENENSIIKVKFTSRHKKKVKKLDNSKVDLVDIHQPKDSENSNTISDINTPKRKRKRANGIQKEEDLKQKQDENGTGRPKRTIKKPVEYSDYILSSSSDEELHIFTPRKKKSLDKGIDIKHNHKSKTVIDNTESKNEVKSKKDEVSGSKSKSQLTLTESDTKSKKKCINLESSKVKLAPIFSTKSKLTPLEQEAKQNFLKSGVPDKLKMKHNDCNSVLSWNTFHTTVHIQQKENINIEALSSVSTNLECKTIDWIDIAETVIKNQSIGYTDEHIFGKLLAWSSDENIPKLSLKHKPEQLLKFIKTSYSKFPVYRTFHLLKTKSKAEIKDCNFPELDNSIEIVNDILDINYDNPDKLTWNDKYKPMSSKQIIGNFDSVKELKKWLESWSENHIKNKNSINDDSDLSDFCFSDSDTDSRDTFKHSNNVLVISGQSGTGKTSCVYAVAAELAIKVIEVNASSKRTGKIMLQDLQEATQSHKVNRGNNKKDGSQSSQEKLTVSKIVKKHGRPKKTYERRSKHIDVVETKVLSQHSQTSSQESTRTEMSLILIDDADIVFDQDDGFCSAVSQLIHYSKRPVILITSSLTCPHLQKYISCGKIIKMTPLLPHMLGTWLDIMCLADTSSCYPGLGCKLLEYFRGDIRKTINFLQFYMTSNKHLNQIEDASQDIDSYKANIDDENSCMSWTDHDIADDNITKEIDDNEMKKIVERQLMLLESGDSDIFNVWWNVANQFSSESQMNCITDISTNVTGGANLDDTSRILDTMSFIDYFESSMNCNAYNVTSKPWSSVELPSVMEKENMDCYNIMDQTSKDISKELKMRSVSILKNWEAMPKCAPIISEQRKRNKIVNQHNTLSKYLNPSVTLDRRSLALDYWSTCRTICRLEKNKTDNNLRRNNRFCHYLKSLNILCKNDYFDNLSESLT